MPLRRWAFVTATALALVVMGEGAASAETMSVCYPMVGHVRDGVGRPIEAATVRASSACAGSPTSTTTDAAGRYELRVPGDALGATVTLTASKAGYSGGSQTGKVTNLAEVRGSLTDIRMQSTSSASSPAPDEVSYDNTDFTLLLALTIAVSPAVRPGSDVAVSVKVAAPPPGGTAAYPALVVVEQEATGEPVTLTAAPDAPGWTLWQGTFHVPADAPDGSRRLRVCATRPDYSGTCGNAAKSDLLSAVVLPGYIVDGTPPVLTTASPGPFRTVTRFSTLTGSWADATSGLGTGFRIWIDGVERYVSTSGGGGVSAFVPSLAPGIHTAELQATDRAGNTTRVSHVFTYAALSATDATATVAEQTVPVNPNASIPPPSTVTFTAPKVSAGAFTETVGASTWVGSGSVRRPVSFGTLTVRFVNESGVPKDVPVTVSTAYATHDVALLAPTQHPQRIAVPAGSTTLADVRVSVPAGYGTPGAKAILLSATAALGAPQTAGAELAPSPLGRVTVSGELHACLSNVPEHPRCADGQAAFASIDQKQVGIPVYPASDEDEDAFAPGCSDAPDAPGSCESAPSAAAAAQVVLGCTDLVVWLTFADGTRSVDVCDGQRRSAPARPGDGAAAAYLNAWVYDAAGGLNPTWQQDHVDVPTGGSRCPNGRTGTVHAYVHRVAANTLPLDGAAAPEYAGTYRDYIAEWTKAQPVGVELGRTEAPTRLPDGAMGARHRPDRGYALARTLTPLDSSDGTYDLVPDAWTDAFGRHHELAGATSNVWQASTADIGAGGVESEVHLTTGTTYGAPETPGYVRAFTLAFQVALDFTGCS